ncbi:MAG: hypothetical protein RLZZ380_809 [Actinomycetota bacterium]|jgi:hypothetical protein
MNSIKALLQKSREKRIQKILNLPNLGWLEIGWVKRLLAVIAVVSSWTFLFALFFDDFNVPSQYWWPGLWSLKSWMTTLMVASFLLLRASLRKISSLPDEYLDERQIADRDWAYRLGYLVVRRIGYGITLLLAASFPVYGGYRALVMNSRGYSLPFWDPHRELSQFIADFFENDPIWQTFTVIGLLTYVAYSFPVILLAWRDAKNYDAAEVAAADAANWEGIIRNAFSGYYRRLRRVGYGLLLTILVGTLPGFASAYVWMYPFLLTILYALYVYGWGMFKLAHVVNVLGNESLPDEIKAARQKQDGLYVSSALLGLLIFVCMLLAILFPQVVAGWAILVMFWGGIVLLIIHLTAFAGLKELFAKPEAE